MSDLVERLRERSISWERADHETLKGYWMLSVQDGHKAADEIERLQAALEHRSAMLKETSEIEERLRSALERIANWGDPDFPCDDMKG